MEGLLVGMQGTQAAADESVEKMTKNAKAQLDYMKAKNEFLAKETEVQRPTTKDREGRLEGKVCRNQFSRRARFKNTA